jgi:hypothetical protein
MPNHTNTAATAAARAAARATAAARHSRRRFLKQAELATGALALSAFIPAAALGRDGKIAPSNRIVRGGVGFGGRGSYVILKTAVESGRLAKAVMVSALAGFVRRTNRCAFTNPSSTAATTSSRNTSPPTADFRVMGHWFLGQPDVQFVAACDVRKTRRLAFNQRVNSHYKNSDCKTYIDMQEMLARPDIEANRFRSRAAREGWQIV